MKAFLAALAASIVVAVLAGVALQSSERPTSEVFQSDSGSVRL